MMEIHPLACGHQYAPQRRRLGPLLKQNQLFHEDLGVKMDLTTEWSLLTLMAAVIITFFINDSSF